MIFGAVGASRRFFFATCVIGGVGAIGFALPSQPAQAGGLLGLSTHRGLAVVGSGGGSAEDRHRTQGTQALREAKR